jgi:hypothetical protein
LFNLFNPILFRIVNYIWENLLKNLMGHTHRSIGYKLK